MGEGVGLILVVVEANTNVGGSLGGGERERGVIPAPF